MQGEHLPAYTWKDEKAMRRNGVGPTSYCVNSLLIKKRHVFGDREEEEEEACENPVLFRCKPPQKQRGRGGGGGTKLKYKKVTIFPVKIQSFRSETNTHSFVHFHPDISLSFLILILFSLEIGILISNLPRFSFSSHLLLFIGQYVPFCFSLFYYVLFVNCRWVSGF